jgi:alpha-tubulin suppressor-like RCC1 family protein
MFDPKVWIPLVPYPLRVQFSRPVSHIACGAFHTLLLTEDGQIFGCGLATNGRLGIEPILEAPKQATPTITRKKSKNEEP